MAVGGGEQRLRSGASDRKLEDWSPVLGKQSVSLAVATSVGQMRALPESQALLSCQDLNGRPMP